MKVLYITNEYPPLVYGGAGVHIEYLSKEVAKLADVEVRCYGDQKMFKDNLKAIGYESAATYQNLNRGLQSVFKTIDRDLQIVGEGVDADIVHCHTWYTHMAGIMAKLNFGVPLVVTTHSLEPLRPWKREQLAGGYDFSLWVEKTAIEMADAVIAVSNGTRADVKGLFNVAEDRLKVIYNGIDTDEFRKTSSTENLKRFDFDPAVPYLLFVGRITRQKGIIHLVNAIKYLNPEIPVVLAAGAADTPEIEHEMTEGVKAASQNRGNIHWIREMVDRKTLIELYSHAGVFCCPSIYEPFGIINLEAMSCGTPVVASAVGGIPEVVIDGVTGKLVALEQTAESPFEALKPDVFAKDLATEVNKLMADPQTCQKMSAAGRRRVEETFSWKSIAAQTVDLYKSLIKGK
ncbi:MAG: glycogen synthase [Candidatus Riflebacteria bacterium]|nr:glycogen synthase [Candidatus Riflebacteria bacterium]